MGWSEQQKIEFNAPEYLKNVIQIVTETGLRIYKELAPLRKEHLDLINGTVWIPDSKTVNGVAEVPLTDIAIEAFRRQLAISGPRTVLIPERRRPERSPEDVQDCLARHVAPGGRSILSDLRPEIYLRHTVECWWQVEPER
jgi:integrase